MLDKYFRYPILIDITLGVVINLILFILYKKGCITLPEMAITMSISTDISTISLTLAGFVLTFLTVIITFKAASKVPDSYNVADITVADHFYSSNYYERTVELLRSGIVMLILSSILGFLLKLILRDNEINYIFFANCFGLVIIITTFWRSLSILTQIVKLQKGQRTNSQNIDS